MTGGSAADLKPGDGSIADVPSKLSHKEPRNSGRTQCA